MKKRVSSNKYWYNRIEKTISKLLHHLFIKLVLLVVVFVAILGEELSVSYSFAKANDRVESVWSKIWDASKSGVALAKELGDFI